MDKDIIRRIAERGRERAVYDAMDPEACRHVDMESYVDLFQHILDELERIE